jgi:DNA-binding IclR family transcriptional regulator
MSGRLVGLDELLRELAGEALSLGEIARRLKLHPLDARLLIAHAIHDGLVQGTSTGRWAISDLGTSALRNRRLR